MKGPSTPEVRRLYGWISPETPEDSWHAETTEFLKRNLLTAMRSSEGPLLNIGCGGFHYGIPTDSMICVDIAGLGRVACNRAVEANAEFLPFVTGTFGTVLCVGSVLNYTDASRVLGEVRRVLREGGILALEFERSEGAPYWGSLAYRQRVWATTTQYKGQEHAFWVYSEAFISHQLRAFGLQIFSRVPFHIASAVVGRLLGSPGAASILRRLDPFATILSRYSANVLLLCRR